MNIKKLRLKCSLSLLAITLVSNALAQNNGQLKKDYAAALQVSEDDVGPILQKQVDALDLSRNLERAIPDDYAGMSISPSKNFSATIF
jgi:hypothetical protein